jgi:hypothetical protein
VLHDAVSTPSIDIVADSIVDLHIPQLPLTPNETSLLVISAVFVVDTSTILTSGSLLFMQETMVKTLNNRYINFII